MKRLRSLIPSLLAIIIVLSPFTRGRRASRSGSDTGARSTAVPVATLRAASGASIRFRPQNGQVRDSASLPDHELPLLVLRRNGVLTDPEERTLAVEVTGIMVPAPGVTVTLHVDTQHGDPDPPDGAPMGPDGAPSLDFLADNSPRRIPVWREARWIANPSGVTLIGAKTVFTHTFGETVISGTETIPMPTDYVRCEVTVIDASQAMFSSSGVSIGSGKGSPETGSDYAALIESQWVAPLPDVREAADGAAPDELVVYYLDMVPFRKDADDPATWLAREDVSRYVGTELVPRMIEAFRVESDDWGFPWYDAWTSYRAGEDAERLSVALSDGHTWFHGRAPRRGHARISIRVSGGNGGYDTLTDGLMTDFYHELFHNLQRNISQNSDGTGSVDGAENAWQFFSEGTAVMASSAGQPHQQFTSPQRAYMLTANPFLGYGVQLTDTNRSYEEILPYHAAIYWRFLYEQCGRIQDGSFDPAAGMEVIRRALTILYAGDVVDITTSTDLVGAMPEIMDRALSGSPCSFDTYAQSLAAFGRALYALGLEGGRCAAPGIPTGCGFYDPHSLYYDPPVSTASYSGTDQQFAGEIPSSFGVDFVDVLLDPRAGAHSLTLELEFEGLPEGAAEFAVQVWELESSAANTRPRPLSISGGASEILKTTNPDGDLSYVILATDTTGADRLGLIITRIDANERLDPVGAYTIRLRPAQTD